MTELFTDTVLNMMTTTAEPEDYTGEDGLLYCGKCRTAKEAYFPKETAAWLGHDKHPTECDCQREKRLECESAEERRRHLDTVMELKRRGFTDLTMQEWTFAHDNGKCPQMSKAHLYVEHPGQCDGQSGYGVTTLDAVVESIVCMKFEEILECSKSNLLEEMRRKDLDAAKKETTRWKEEVQTKVDEQDALKKEMIRVIQGTSGLDREMIQQMVNENKEALLTAQTNLADSEKKLKEIEEQNQKAERNCSDLFTWASTYKGASFERRQAILKQFIKEVRVGRDYNIEIVLNVPLDEFEEFKRHAASAGRGKNQKNKSQNPQKVGRCTSNAGIVVLDKTAGETVSIVPKNAAHAILRC